MNKKIALLLSLLFFIFAAFHASSIFTTFFIALSIAYLLQPAAHYLSKKSGLSYKVAALFIFGIFIAFLISLMSIVIPKFIGQIELLLQKIPLFQDAIKNHLLPLISKKLQQLDKNVAEQVKNIFMDIGSSFGNALTSLLNMLWHSLRSTINLLTMCLLLPILLVFFLKDWPEITNSFKSFIKRTGYDEINLIWEEIDDLISGFIKALLFVSFIMAVLYTLSLSIIGFEFALIFGVISGFAVLIPFVGPIIAVSSCLMMSVLIHGFEYQQVLILIVFGIIQALDSSFLTPKIVGDKIGLHPTVIIFSIFVGSSMLGVAGLFLAIPIAGIIKIIFNRFILDQLPD